MSEAIDTYGEYWGLFEITRKGGRHEPVRFTINHNALSLSRAHLFSVAVGTEYDPKSLSIVGASIMLFFLPIALFVDERRVFTYIGIVIMGFVVAYFTPPVGWRRPHPYSDDPTNRPKRD
jgi:hypothetical protein